MIKRQSQRKYRGAAAVLAMLFLVILAALSTAMYTVSTLNQRTAYNYIGADRARLASETGMNWIAYRLRVMPKPITKVASMGGTFAYDTLWNNFVDPDGTAVKGLSTCIVEDLQNLSGATVTRDGHIITTSDIRLDSAANGARFSVKIVQDYDRGQRMFVVVTGRYGGGSGRPGAKKSVQMEFWIDKQIRYAVAGKVPIQIGKNVMVDGNIAMTSQVYKNQPAILALSDFKYVPNQWSTFQGYQDFMAELRANSTLNFDKDYSNRINIAERADLAGMANKLGYSDVNGDGYIDEYDLFVSHFSYSNSDNGAQISKGQYLADSDYGQDAAMFKAIDNLHALYGQNVSYQSGTTNDYASTGQARPGFADAYIDRRDQYAKIYGKLTVYDSGGINTSLLQGPVVNPDSGTAVQIGFSEEDKSIYSNLEPASFAACSDRLRTYTGDRSGVTAQRSAGALSDTTLRLSDQTLSDNGGRPMGDYELVQVSSPGNTSLKPGQAVTIAQLNAANSKLGTGKTPASYAANANYSVEQTPWGSTSYQAIYKRPVFRNMHLTNVVIPKGMNPVFVNCTFDGVTFAETQSDIGTTDSGDPTWNWVKARTDGGSSGTDLTTQVCLPSTALAGSPAQVSKTTEVRTKGSEQGNNIRFDSCTFNGPVAGNNATSYTHCANSWEFTGNSMLQNTWKDPGSQTETVAICSPQVNIEMGSYQAGKMNTINLQGVIVAGNFDVRGQGYIDGQIIITGDGAGNTTLGYFGANDGATSVSASDVSKSGCLIVRYNPKRGLPYGISIPLSITPDRATYREFLK